MQEEDYLGTRSTPEYSVPRSTPDGVLKYPSTPVPSTPNTYLLQLLRTPSLPVYLFA
jgi:hypothetical protein